MARRNLAAAQDLQHVQAAPLDRALAQQPPAPLRELGAGRPTDVPAFGAFVEPGAALIVADCPQVAAAQALDLPQACLHTYTVGVRVPETTPGRGKQTPCYRRDGTARAVATSSSHELSFTRGRP